MKKTSIRFIFINNFDYVFLNVFDRVWFFINFAFTFVDGM